ncbi:histidinol-phosphate aminotransferase family protein, partial [Haliea sp. E17]
MNRRLFLGAVAGAAGLAASSGRLAHAAGASTLVRPDVIYGPAPGIARLNSNENPYGPSPAALKALAEASAQGAYYVGDSAIKLRA